MCTDIEFWLKIVEKYCLIQKLEVYTTFYKKHIKCGRKFMYKNKIKYYNKKKL